MSEQSFPNAFKKRRPTKITNAHQSAFTDTLSDTVHVALTNAVPAKKVARALERMASKIRKHAGL